MTAIIKALVMGEYLDIELQRDGSFDIANRGLEYEQAFEAFGGGETAATIFAKAFERDAIGTLLGRYFDVEPLVRDYDARLIKLFAVDMVDHVAGIYEEYASSTHLSRVLGALREIIAQGDFGRSSISRVLDLKDKLLSGSRTMDYDMFDTESVREIKKAIERLLGIGFIPVVTSNALPIGYHVLDIQRYSANAVAYDAGGYNSEAYKRECGWQLRRFVHLMEAHQGNEPLPPMEETR